MPSRHAIIKLIKENATIITCIVIAVGVIYGYGKFDNKIENLTTVQGKQTDAIVGLTKAFNCHNTGGDPNQCSYTSPILGSVDCAKCNSVTYSK